MQTKTDLDRFKDARIMVAQLVLMDRTYAPLFTRIENEIAALEADRDLISRARAIVQLQKATG